MGTWIELRCENRDSKSSWGDGLGGRGNGCWSHINEGHGELALDTRADLLETMRQVERQAKEAGWVKSKFGWVCPFCRKQPTHMEEIAAFYAPKD